MPKHPQPSIERRPIAARTWRVSQLAARWVARKNITPNTISIAGMVCGVLAGCEFGMTREMAEESRWHFALGSLLVLLRLLANMLDGMVAIEGGKRSPVGELYNEVPDRVSDVATLIGFGYAIGADAMLGFLAACMALFVAYVRAQGKAVGAPNDFCGPMAKQQRMAIIILIGAFCAVAPMEWQPIWFASRGWGLPAAGLWLIIIGSALTALRRLKRIAHHLRNRPT